MTALYEATGYLEAARRVLNVVFEARRRTKLRTPQAGDVKDRPPKVIAATPRR
jgi:hypothetical protein